MNELHIFTGNHKSPAGIEDICQILLQLGGSSSTSGIYLKQSNINLVIEDFSSPEITKYIIESKLEIGLVLTEFMSLGPFGKIVLNKFGYKSNRFVLLANDLVILIFRYLRVVIPRKLKSKIEEKIYWKNREVGLRKVLKYCNLKFIICMHPEIQ